MTARLNRPPILVLGVGNILLRDEGVGVHVVRALEHERLPESVEVYDGATCGVDLIDVLAQRRRVIIIDAVDAGRPPGEITRWCAEDLVAARGLGLSLHEAGMAEVLRMTRLLNCAPDEVIVFGIQPESVEPGLELTDTVAGAVTAVVGLVRKELASMP